MVKLLTAQGTQIDYTADKIGPYFSLTEARFQNDIKLYGQVVICDPLFKVLNKYRELKKAPVILNSLNRSRQKQLELIDSGARAAKMSPHEFFLAADCDTTTWEETQRDVKLIRQASASLGIKVRIGFVEYWMKDKSTFIHVDVCPEYFGPGKPWTAVLHPRQWENAIEW